MSMTLTATVKVYQVKLQAQWDYRSKPDDIEKIYVKSSTGQMVPLGKCD